MKTENSNYFASKSSLKLRSKYFKKIFILIVMINLSLTSCSSNDSNLSASTSSVEQVENITLSPTPNSSKTDELEFWEEYAKLPEKDFIKLAKSENPENYLNLNYGIWDEQTILKLMSKKCIDYSLMPYGLITDFIDTSKINHNNSAVIFYVCIASAGSSLSQVIYITKDNESIKVKQIVSEDVYFRIRDVKLVKKNIEFVILESRNPPKLEDKVRIYFLQGQPVMEFLTFNDEHINNYYKKFGPFFNLETWTKL